MKMCMNLNITPAVLDSDVCNFLRNASGRFVPFWDWLASTRLCCTSNFGKLRQTDFAISKRLDLWDSSINGIFSLVLIVVWNLFQDEWKFFQKCHKISILLYFCLVNVFHEIYLFHSRKIFLKDFNFVTFYCCFLNLTKRYKNCWSQLTLNKIIDYTFIIIQWLPLMLCNFKEKLQNKMLRQQT